jgi:hypothetical protein
MSSPLFLSAPHGVAGGPKLIAGHEGAVTVEIHTRSAPQKLDKKLLRCTFYETVL